MKRVASLYLPTLATDRLRRRERPRVTRPDRLPLEPLPGDDDPYPCSCPRGGGWRPGARWAREGGGFVDDRPPDKRAVAAAIATLPAHRRPPMRELGRRSEAAALPFRAMPPDEAGAPSLPLAVAPAGSGGALATIHVIGQRQLIAAVSARATCQGVTVGMAATHARLIAPGIELRPHDAGAVTALLKRLADHAVRHWTPGAAIDGDDGLWLDLSGVVHLFGGERRMAARILRTMDRVGIAARIAVAATPGAAHALARHGDAPLTSCPAGGEAAAIAPLPPAALRLDAAALAMARRLGIESVGALAAMPRAPVARRFGAATLERIDQALGRIGEAIEPVIPADTPAVRLALVEPIATAEAIAQVLADAVDALVLRLAAGGRGVRVIWLEAERVDGDRLRFAIGTARATRDPIHLKRLLTMRIERIDPGFGIEALSLSVSRHEPLAAEAITAWDMAGTAALAPLVDRIAGRIGVGRLYRSSAIESDVPERSVARVGPLESATGWPCHWPRPARLLAPPEPVDQVLALLPDHPPRRFRWRGRTHVLVKGDGPERIYGEWWRSGAEEAAVRDYFRVEDETGARFWLFRRGAADDPLPDDRWYLHGLFG